jgi:hypothetical protein
MSEATLLVSLFAPIFALTVFAVSFAGRTPTDGVSRG